MTRKSSAISCWSAAAISVNWLLASTIIYPCPAGLEKDQTIICEEMDRAGGREVLLPAVQPMEVWKESGRWDFYGKELLRMNDRKGASFASDPPTRRSSSISFDAMYALGELCP